MAAAAAGVLQGNLFPVADSDFETALTGDWAATSNCTLAQSATHAFTGSDALRISTTAAGTSVFTYAGMPVRAGLGYTLSWYALATANGRTAQASLVFRAIGGGQVGPTVSLAVYSVANASWTPAADTFSPPATAVTADISVTVTSPATTEHTYFDLFYCAQVPAQVLISWNAQPLADPQFADVTPWVRIDQPITVGARGRQDNISEVQTGPATLTVDNTLGWFTAGGSSNASPWAPGVKIGRRMVVSFPDETGKFWKRFDGQLTELPTSWTGPGAFDALTVISASDVLARVNREPTLETWSEEEVLAGSPLVFYDLTDASGSTTASDSSGSLSAPLQVKTYGAAPPTPQFFDFFGFEIPISFGPTPATVPAGTAVPATGIPLVETTTDPVTGELSGPLPTWLFTPSTSAVAQLEGALPSPVAAAAGFAFGCWANCTQALAQQTLIMLGNRAAGLVVGIQITAAGLLELVTSSNFLASSPTLKTLSAGTVPGPITLTVPGTGHYTAGPGITALRVQAWGAGGPGQGTDGTGGDTGSGGAGAEYAEEPDLPITGTQSFFIGASAVGPSDGQDTTFGSPVKVHAHGGFAGNTSVSTPPGVPGGTGSTNTIHFDGGASASVAGSGGGSSGGPGAAGTDSTDTSGAAAVDGGGPGGDEDASPATGPGGGGGGSESADFGGAGFDGQLTITPLGPSGPGFFVAVSVASDIATLYVNNCPAGQLTLPAGATYDWLTIGGPMNGANGLSGWNGSIGLAAVYPAPVGPDEFATQWAAGTTGFAGSTTGQMVANLARYAGLPAFWYTPPTGPADASNGLTTVSYMDLTGAQPLTQMQLYEQVEAGVLYVNAAGQLAFSDRAARYAAGSASQPAFVLAAGQYGADTAPKSNDQYLQNAAALSTANIPAGVLALNQGSIDDYGPYAPQGESVRTLQPTVGPWPDAASVAGTYSADDLQDSAQWTTGTLGEPGNRIPAITIDVLTLPPGEFSLAAFYQQVDIGSAVELAGLPSQAPAGLTAPYLIAEGFTEVVQLGVHTIAINTSPAAQSNAWILGDPLLGVLGETTVTGRSATPAALGPPYAPVATFSASMNRTGGVGAQDLRTLTDAVSRRLQPAFALAQQASAGTGGLVTWDTVLADTAGGFGGFGSTGTAYTVAQDWPGDYLCLAVVQFAHGQAITGAGAWFTVSLAGGGPASWYPAYVAYKSTNASYTALSIAGIIGPCLPGDTISVTADPGSANLGVADGGSMLAVIWQGRGTGVPPALAARSHPIAPKHPRFRKGRIYR